MSMTAIGRHVSKLSGYAPALPTPFDADDHVDCAAFERLCARQVAEGATALVVGGTTGESATLTESEHVELIRIARSASGGRVPVVAGAGSNATAHAVALTRDAEAAGADAILSVVPYYNKPTQVGIAAHFRAIAAATALPIILYDVPSRTVTGLADDTVAQLAELPQVIGLKDASGDVTRPARLRPRVGTHFRLLSGDDATAPAFLAQGGDGCISVTSNVAPGLCRAIYLMRGPASSPRARRLGDLHRRLTDALFREGNPSPVKYALGLIGLMSARVRLPLVEPTEATRRGIRTALADVVESCPDYLVDTSCSLAMASRAAAE
jgi:4-hydroxy-tetrahydrodipicolinate synthase